MATKPIFHGIQDLPPKGGYPQINHTRGIRPRGPPGWAIWAGVVGSTIFGFYKIGQYNKKHRMIRKETREARMAIIPYLQAEKDRKMVVQLSDSLAHEKEIMKHNPDWIAGESVYSKRWNTPQV